MEEVVIHCINAWKANTNVSTPLANPANRLSLPVLVL